MPLADVTLSPIMLRKWMADQMRARRERINGMLHPALAKLDLDEVDFRAWMSGRSK